MPKKQVKKQAEKPRRKQKSKDKYSRLRGMKDILFDEYKYWDLVTKKAIDLASVYSFKRIETPVLERAELYERTTGKESTIHCSVIHPPRFTLTQRKTSSMHGSRKNSFPKPRQFDPRLVSGIVLFTTRLMI